MRIGEEIFKPQVPGTEEAPKKEEVGKEGEEDAIELKTEEEIAQIEGEIEAGLSKLEAMLASVGGEEGLEKLIEEKESDEEDSEDRVDRIMSYIAILITLVSLYLGTMGKEHLTKEEKKQQVGIFYDKLDSVYQTLPPHRVDGTYYIIKDCFRICKEKGRDTYSGSFGTEGRGVLLGGGNATFFSVDKDGEEVEISLPFSEGNIATKSRKKELIEEIEGK